MSHTGTVDLQEILALPLNARVDALGIASQTLSGPDAPASDRAATIAAILSLLEEGTGSARQRMQLGESLSLLGDPRLRTPDQDTYWVQIQTDDGSVSVGVHMVTVAAFQGWIAAGGYADDAHWCSAGLVWRDSTTDHWSKLAADPEVAHLIFANQPAVGPNWYEACAYARAHGARLLRVSERRAVVRGETRRPYPWGQPFGAGKANTREEALGKPCAVGLFLDDKTPDGIFDLAGNAAEWLADQFEDLCSLHPGSWVQPSMASWSKALERSAPDTRSADLGFRITRDS